jgi:hypothetical protein
MTDGLVKDGGNTERRLDSPVLPLFVSAPGAGNEGWIVRATWAFVALGVMARLIRYLVDYPIWHDEAFLAVNLWDRDYVDLLRPLDYGQVAPWLFLAIERTMVARLGYFELTLRLFPTICSILSLVLFRHVAARLFGGSAQLLAVAILATAFYPIRHGAEIKPYASDLLAAVVFLALAVEWLRAQDSCHWWWILTAVAPILIALSYPAVFVAGGISLALAHSVFRKRHRPVRLAFIVFNVVVAASFIAVYLSCTVFQAQVMGEVYRRGYWADSFPPLDRPWMVPLWFLDRHTGTMMAYPIGERHGGSVATTLALLAGCLLLAERRHRSLLALLLAPFGMGLLASLLGKYPYGGAPRIMQYGAPSICLLAGLGAAGLLVRFPKLRDQRRVLAAALVSLGLLGCWLIGRDLARPYRVESDLRSREFAKWFWNEKAKDAGLACLKSDLGIVLNERLWRVGMSAVYLFHQRKYSERHQKHEAISLSPRDYSSDHPLRLVVFEYATKGNRPLEEVTKGLRRDFAVRKTDSYVIRPGTPAEDWLRDAYTVLEFVPRPDAAVIGAGKSGEGAGRRL